MLEAKVKPAETSMVATCLRLPVVMKETSSMNNVFDLAEERARQDSSRFRPDVFTFQARKFIPIVSMDVEEQEAASETG